MFCCCSTASSHDDKGTPLLAGHTDEAGLPAVVTALPAPSPQLAEAAAAPPARPCLACGARPVLKPTANYCSDCKSRQEAGIIPMAEVRLHRSEFDAWTVLDGIVYDITPYLRSHPGGRDQLLRGAGTDMTYMFSEFHHWVSGEMIVGNL